MRADRDAAHCGRGDILQEKLVVIDGLGFEEADGDLDDEDALGVAPRGLEHDTSESLVASASEGNSLLRFD